MARPRTTEAALRSAFLATRFGRRLFALFVVAALLPIAVLGVLSYRTVGAELRAQADARLHRSARATGLLVAQRLFQLADPDGEPTDAEVASRLANRAQGLVLRVEPAPDGGPARLLLVDPYANGTSGARELPHEAVFGDLHDLILPDRGEFMVIAQGAWIAGSVGAGQALPRAWRAIPPERRLVDWSSAGEAYLGRAREVFLEAGIGADPWTLVVLEPRDEVLGAMAPFRRALVAVLALTLLGVPLLAVNQIRRRLLPLERLRDGAQRIGRRDFQVRVEAGGDDEFQEVALAFNAMARDLTAHVQSLDTLLEIDREILTAGDALEVSGVLVRRAFSLARCDAAMVALRPAGPRDDGLTLVSTAADEPVRGPVAHPTETASWTGYAWQDVVLRPEEGPALQTLAAFGIRYLRVVPMEATGQPLGALLLARRDEPFGPDDPGAYLRQLADQASSAFSHLRERERRRTLAYFDPLTGLPNRFRFEERLGQAIRLDRERPEKHAVCLVELEGIPRILETLGHAAAEELLREVAVRITQEVGRDETYRLERTEFAVLIADAEQAASVAGRLLEVLQRPVQRLQDEVVLTAAVGVAIHPQDGDSSELLLRNARTALRAAGSGGGARVRFYSPPMHARARARLSLESDLRRAIRRGELEVAFQPIVDIASQDLVGSEALARWQRNGEPVSPTDFVALAEQAGLIGELGAFVMRSACQQLAGWLPDAPGLGLHVNVSPLQLRDGRLPGLVRSVIADTGIPHRALTLEITESTFTDQGGDTLALLEEVIALGVGLAIDDFGTGYSSLAQLRHLPARVVKIDRCFVERVPGDAADAAVVRAIVEMAHGRGLRVVAEGVETEAQLAFLREARCDEAQGYLFAAPLAADAFGKYLREAVARGAVGELPH